MAAAASSVDSDAGRSSSSDDDSSGGGGKRKKGSYRRVLLVVAAALINQRGEVLLAQRPEGKMRQGLWEFPGEHKLVASCPPWLRPSMPTCAGLAGLIVVAPTSHCH